MYYIPTINPKDYTQYAHIRVTQIKFLNSNPNSQPVLDLLKPWLSAKGEGVKCCTSSPGVYVQNRRGFGV